MKPETFAKLKAKVSEQFSNNADKIYVFDGYSGANPESRKKVNMW